MRRLFMLFAVVGSLAVGPAAATTALAQGSDANRPTSPGITSPGGLVRLPIHAQPNGRYWS
jgi:hypothetical protein